MRRSNRRHISDAADVHRIGAAIGLQGLSEVAPGEITIPAEIVFDLFCSSC